MFALFEGRQGNLQAADEAFRQAREILLRLVDGYPGFPRYRYLLAVTHWATALLKWDAEDYQAAREDLELAQSYLVELVREFPDNADFQSQLQQTEADLRDLPGEQPQMPPQDQ